MQSQFAILIKALVGLYIPPNRLRPWSSPSDKPADLKSVMEIPQGMTPFSKDSYACFAACESYHVAWHILSVFVNTNRSQLSKQVVRVGLGVREYEQCLTENALQCILRLTDQDLVGSSIGRHHFHTGRFRLRITGRQILQELPEEALVIIAGSRVFPSRKMKGEYQE